MCPNSTILEVKCLPNFYGSSCDHGFRVCSFLIPCSYCGTFPCCKEFPLGVPKRRKLRSSQDLNLVLLNALTTEPLELWHWSRGQMDRHRYFRILVGSQFRYLLTTDSVNTT